MLNSSNIIQPKVVIIRRPPPPNNSGFGFTLRHFIAYPSDDDTAIFIDQASQRKVPLETIFIKEVSPTGPAAFSGLKTGDRVIMVNNSPINGMSYNAIVQMIKTTPDVLYLHVLPKECDVLQMSYGFAHTPESNISMNTNSTTLHHHNHLHNNKLIEFPHATAAAAAAVAAASAVPQQTLVSSHHFATTSSSSNSTPGGTGTGMIPIYPHTKHQQPQAQQQVPLQQQQQQHIHKNMISYSDATYSSIQQLQQQQQRKAMSSAAAAAASSSLSPLSSALSPSSMSTGQHMLQKHHLQQQHSSSSNEVVYSDINPSSLALRNDGTLIRSAKPANLTVLQKPNSPDNELMIRLRKSIEQKEEFLKSPVPHPQSAFFSSSNNNICNQSIMSRHSLPSTGASSSSLSSTRSRFLYNPHPQPPQKSTSSLLPASYDMNTFYKQNLPIGLSDTLLAGRGSYDTFTKRISNHQNILIHNRSGIEENMNRRKYNKDIEYLDTLTELGVTNQFFERSSSHLKKGFDPFKQLTINTGGHGPLPADSIESLKMLSVNNIEPTNSILSSSRTNNRMETHKANLAQTKAEVYAPPQSPAISEEVIYEETLPLQNYKQDVVRRQTVSCLDDNKQLRRTSYLRATTGTTSPTASLDSCMKRMSYAHEILERSNDDIIELNGKPLMKDAATEVEIFETEMEIKSSCINGKRISEYRSWKQVKIEIKGDILKIYPGRSSKMEANVIELDVRNFNILDESVDKKKCVFKLRSISSDLAGLEDDSSKENTEILFKTKSINDMKKILAILREKCATISNSSDVEKQGKQTAEPQKTAATTSTYCDDNTSGGQDYSPTSSTLEQDSISPNPRRKPSKQEKDLGSPKSKSNWKDFFSRKNHGNTADISPSTLSSSSAKTIGSIGVPLKSCPMSKDNEYVPHIVDVCTKIVEAKGLGTTGIYRVPGNKAAISELKEQVNRSDFAWDKCSTDVRWEDVNVVSSLLKQFIRDLPDALLPSTFYINFIEADKKQGERRLLELRYLLKDLPPHSYETMKHIIRHLHRISKNCDVNLMEPKNLAIIFGPSIIRTTNDTLESAVKDMKHQCRIVESLVTNYEFFFEDGELPELDTNSTISSTCTSHHDQTTLLLHNVPKIEQRNHDKESTFKRFMPNLRTRTHSKRSGVSSDTYSEESVLSLEIRKSPDVSSKEKKSSKSSKKTNGSGSSIGSTSGGNEDSKDIRHIEIISSPISDYDVDDGEDGEENGSTATSNSNENLKEGSMSLAAITDTLDTKLKNLRSGSESNDESSIGADNTKHNRPLISYENIPYVDDDQSPERHTNPIIRSKLPINHLQKPNNYRYSSVYESFSDDSEVSTTSDPKESLVINPSFLDRYKKRRDYKLFRSASFNCRNYRNGNRSGENNYNCNNVTTTTQGTVGGGALTKDEKTDMNLTKKRQIQNKQNRSIKRRHTVGGPHDYNPTSNNRRKPKGGAKIAPIVAATAKI